MALLRASSCMMAAVPVEISAGPPFVLALDVGTSSARASLFDCAGTEVPGTRARVERQFVTTQDGGAELDAEAALAEVVSVVEESLACSGQMGKVAALAAACFWHSLVGVDAQGRAVTPVYGWADTRAAAQAEELRREFDEREVHARTGCRLHPSYWPAKLRWLRDERPALFHAAHLWLSFGEYLTLRLCGSAHASASMASGTGLLDRRGFEWDEPLAAAAGVSAGQLPAVAGDGDSFELTAEYAARWPRLAGARVFPPVGDGAANNVGEGCVTRARAALMVGTSGAMRVAYEDGGGGGEEDEGGETAALDPSLWSYRVDRRRAVVGGALSDGGGLFEWMLTTLGDPRLEEEAAALAPDAHDLTVLPFWSGERSTNWNPRARGAVLGLTLHTRPAELLRASLEAVACRFALIARALTAHHTPDAEVRASGGALLASRLWAQIIADALGRPLTLSRVAEASSRGAALLALEALGALQSVSDAQTDGGETVEPDPAANSAYAHAIGRQQEFYDRLYED